MPHETKSLTLSDLADPCPAYLDPSTIIVGERQRPLDETCVRVIAEGIKNHGQLQPIGVRRRPNGTDPAPLYDLVFGAHRHAAIQLLEKDGYQPPVGELTVWARIYPADYPDERVKIDELIENLHRKELTPKERSAQTTSYIGWLKKLGLVQDADSKRGGTLKSKEGGVPEDAAHLSLPTATEKVVTDLGISRDTVQHRVNQPVELAETEGVTISEDQKGIEAMDADKLIEVGDAAMVAASKKPTKKRQPKAKEPPPAEAPEPTLAEQPTISPTPAPDPDEASQTPEPDEEESQSESLRRLGKRLYHVLEDIHNLFKQLDDKFDLAWTVLSEERKDSNLGQDIDWVSGELVKLSGELRKIHQRLGKYVYPDKGKKWSPSHQLPSRDTFIYRYS